MQKKRAISVRGESSSDDCLDEDRESARCQDQDKAPQVRIVHSKTMPEELPISVFRNEIVELLKKNSVIVIVGETGSGKSTQISQFLQDDQDFRVSIFGAEHRKDGIRIAVTQPRRVAAIAMARRVAEERGVSLGDEVSYTIRFDDRSTPKTKIRYLTDGCLLRECLHDRYILAYQVIILDEAHERSVSTDILFGLVKQSLARRAGNLRVVITSATLDTELFSKYFDGAPVLCIPGRCYPVDVHYAPLAKGGSDARVEASVNAALRLHLEEEQEAGHILVFLTGMEECERACTLSILKLHELVESGREVGDCVTYPLYGALSAEDQSNVFRELDKTCRKVIFATNIAETSLTVEHIAYVIDTGHVKQNSYNPRTGIDVIETVQVSKVQALQRAGRAGRTRSGKCFRLYGPDIFKRLSDTTLPEIKRANLSSVVLQLKCMGIEDPLHFDFLEKPHTASILIALKRLVLLNALSETGELTDEGRWLVELPLEPTYARCVLAGKWLKVEEDMIILVGLLSSESIYNLPSKNFAEARERACEIYAQYQDASGDHLTLLRIFEQWQRSNHNSTFCRDSFLSFRALRIADNIRQQLSDQLRKLKTPRPHQQADIALVGCNDDETTTKPISRSERIRRALSAGLFINAARHTHSLDAWITIGEGVTVRMGRNCVLLDSVDADWVIFSDLVGLSGGNGVMRTVSIVQHQWLSPFLERADAFNPKHIIEAFEGTNVKKPKAEMLAFDPARPLPLPSPTSPSHVQSQQKKLADAKARFLERKTHM